MEFEHDEVVQTRRIRAGSFQVGGVAYPIRYGSIDLFPFTWIGWIALDGGVHLPGYLEGVLGVVDDRGELLQRRAAATVEQSRTQFTELYLQGLEEPLFFDGDH